MGIRHAHNISKLYGFWPASILKVGRRDARKKAKFDIIAARANERSCNETSGKIANIAEIRKRGAT